VVDLNDIWDIAPLLVEKYAGARGELIESIAKSPRLRKLLGVGPAAPARTAGKIPKKLRSFDDSVGVKGEMLPARWRWERANKDARIWGADPVEQLRNSYSYM
jgi:hypothetical protein